HLKSVSQEMAKNALRVLAVGMVNNETHFYTSFDELKGKVKILGLIGQIDPPREEVFEAVKSCRLAGIRPVMITGDHKSTALAIGKKLGFVEKSNQALEGSEIENLSPQQLKELLPSIGVFARVLPEQKLKIVKALQEQGEVVAMTGDGVNDAPALVQADVGVAMGITGTEVAKEASKIIITDDNFSTIVKAVAEGRLVYQNIKKLILFLFVTSIDEVIILLLALVFGYPPPLADVKILWLN
ncbi:MAG: HAD-IC family P-type ATPase, partial [Bdellovibrionales bacterium]